MPYIKQEDKSRVNSFGAETSGELNFAITRLLIKYIEAHGLSYQIINDIAGALCGATAEFQRRVVVDYEDAKIEENGDVYP